MKNKKQNQMEEFLAQEEFNKSFLGSGVLAKSILDAFDYRIKLKTGDVIRYEQANIIGEDWIHLVNAYIETETTSSIAGKLPRGIDVRISEIVFAVDAPFGG